MGGAALVVPGDGRSSKGSGVLVIISVSRVSKPSGAQSSQSEDIDELRLLVQCFYTSPSLGLAGQPKRCTRVWRLEPKVKDEEMNEDQLGICPPYHT